MNKIMDGKVERILRLDAVERNIEKQAGDCHMELDKVICDGIEENDDFAKVLEQSLDFEVRLLVRRTLFRPLLLQWT